MAAAGMGEEVRVLEHGEARKAVDGACVNLAACARAHRACALATIRYPVSGVARTFARGQVLDEGAVGGPVIRTVHSGLVALCVTLADGRRQILALATAGDMLTDCRLAGLECRVQALAPSVVCELDLSTCVAAVDRDGELQRALLAASRQRLEAAMAHVLALGRLDGGERIVAFLAEMTHRLGRKDHGLWRVHLPLSREDMADYLGLNAETVSRILGRVKRAGLAVFRSPTELEVPDLHRLESRTPFRPLRRYVMGPALREAKAP